MNNLTSKRLFFILLAVAAMLVIAFTGIVFKATAVLESEGDTLVELKLNDKVLDKRKQNLAAAKRDIKKFSELAATAKQIIPQDKDQASTIAEISDMAKESNINIGSIDFPQSGLGLSKGKKNTPTDSTKSQLIEVPDMKGVYIMNIGISNNTKNPVTYTQVLELLQKLESSRRTAQVTNLSISPVDNGLYNFQITINTYVRPE